MRRRRTGAAVFLRNPSQGSGFVEAVGKLITNFGGIEFYSHIWVIELSRDEIVTDLAVELPLSKRIDLVNELVDRERMPKRWKAESTKLWTRAKKLSETRNIVAHSPIPYSWRDRPADGPPDLIGIPNMKQIRRRHGGRLPITPLPDLHTIIDELVSIGESLDSQLNQYRDELTRRRGPRPKASA